MECDMSFIREHKFIAVCVLAAVITVAGVFVMLGKETSADTKEQAESIRQAIYDRALQCYVIEGAYPESLAYLEENYGLAVNHDDYVIAYSAYAENQPPEIRVQVRKKK
jgi:hypothetical protein